jgi:hypothetical protein
MAFMESTLILYQLQIRAGKFLPVRGKKVFLHGKNRPGKNSFARWMKPTRQKQFLPGRKKLLFYV